MKCVKCSDSHSNTANDFALNPTKKQEKKFLESKNTEPNPT